VQVSEHVLMCSRVLDLDEHAAAALCRANCVGLGCLGLGCLGLASAGLAFAAMRLMTSLASGDGSE
jgi:hypothetical protein